MKRTAAALLIVLACIVVDVVSWLQMIGSAALGGGKRFWRLALAHDQTGNVLAGGMVDEMVSARAYRVRGKDSRWVRVIDWLALQVASEKDHCKTAFETEYKRAQLPPVYRIGD